MTPELVVAIGVLIVVAAAAWVLIPYLTRKPPAQHRDRSSHSEDWRWPEPYYRASYEWLTGRTIQTERRKNERLTGSTLIEVETEMPDTDPPPPIQRAGKLPPSWAAYLKQKERQQK